MNSLLQTEHHGTALGLRSAPGVPDPQAQLAADRLRAALTAAGHPMPHAGLLELSVVAARLLHGHAAQIREAQERQVRRSLPSSDQHDPWRVGAWVWTFDTGSGRGQRHRIDHRESDATGERLSLQGASLVATRRAGAGYARHGPWGTGFVIPDGLTDQEAYALLPAPSFRGEYQAFGVPGIRGVAHNASPTGYIWARSWREVGYLCSLQGYASNLTYLRAYGLPDTGGSGAAAAQANPGVLVVEDQELTGTRHTYTPHLKWLELVEARRVAMRSAP